MWNFIRKFIKQEKIVKLIWLKYLIKIKNEIRSCELFDELTKIKNNNLIIDIYIFYVVNIYAYSN